MLALALLMMLAGVASWSLLQRRASVQPVPTPPVIAPLARGAARLDARAASESAPKALQAETPGSTGVLPVPSVLKSAPPNALAPASEASRASESRPKTPSVRRVDAPAPPKHSPPAHGRATPRQAPKSSNEFEKEWM